jgi:hypothetical protein
VVVLAIESDVSLYFDRSQLQQVESAGECVVPRFTAGRGACGGSRALPTGELHLHDDGPGIAAADRESFSTFLHHQGLGRVCLLRANLCCQRRNAGSVAG